MIHCKRCLASRNSASSSLLDRLTVDKRWQRKALVLGTFHAASAVGSDISQASTFSKYTRSI